MRKVLTFEVMPESPGGGPLLELAVALRQLNPSLEGLVWTAVPLDGTLKSIVGPGLCRPALAARPYRQHPPEAGCLRGETVERRHRATARQGAAVHGVIRVLR